MFRQCSIKLYNDVATSWKKKDRPYPTYPINPAYPISDLPNKLCLPYTDMLGHKCMMYIYDCSVRVTFPTHIDISWKY